MRLRRRGRGRPCAGHATFTLVTDGASDFIFQEGPTTLPPLYGMSVAVAFRPSAAGQRTATMLVASDGGNVTVSLSGMGAAPPPIALTSSKSALVFPATIVATASAAMTFSLGNSGTVPLTLVASSGGADAADSSVAAQSGRGCSAPSRWRRCSRAAAAERAGCALDSGRSPTESLTH